MEGPWAEHPEEENAYQYNGKELNTDFDVNWLDYGARWYDPSIGRFSSIDPLAEDYSSISPYVYTLNNPIRLIDPDGAAPADCCPGVTTTINAVVRYFSSNKESSESDRVRGGYEFTTGQGRFAGRGDDPPPGTSDGIIDATFFATGGGITATFGPLNAATAFGNVILWLRGNSDSDSKDNSESTGETTETSGDTNTDENTVKVDSIVQFGLPDTSKATDSVETRIYYSDGTKKDTSAIYNTQSTKEAHEVEKKSSTRQNFQTQHVKIKKEKE